MIKHFAADGTVKREWPDGLHASGFEQDGKRFASVAKSNSVETVELADGEQVGSTFVAAISSALAAADVHPIEAALAATPGADPKPLPPVAIAPEPEPTDIVMGTGPDATPVIETESGELVPTPAGLYAKPFTPLAVAPESVMAIAGPFATYSITEQEHHAPLPSEVVETAAHALSDAAEVLKQEEARNALHYTKEELDMARANTPIGASNALNVEPQEAQATHSTEAEPIPTVEAQHG